MKMTMNWNEVCGTLSKSLAPQVHDAISSEIAS